MPIYVMCHVLQGPLYFLPALLKSKTAFKANQLAGTDILEQLEVINICHQHQKGFKVTQQSN